MTSNSLQGITALVTGAAGGLGKAIATAYLNAGANVAICDINEARLASTREELEPTGRFAAFKTDITDEAAVAALFADVVSKFGRLDILVNNAGMADSFNPVGDLPRERWDLILNVNLTGSFLCMKQAVQQMQKQSPAGGTILQIGSNASHFGFNAGVAYTVAKHGVAALTKHTAAMYGDEGIYTVCLMLGAMPDTNISEGIMSLGGFSKEGYAKSAATYPFTPEQAVQPRDVAKYCVFLADRDIAATANGSCVPFNKNWPKA